MAKLHEEGEPTNSASSGGIDAPESKLGDKVARRKKKKKKLKSFKKHVNESKLFRGYDPEYDILGRQDIVWFSTKKGLAITYAYQNAPKTTELTVGYIDYNPKKSYNAGWDNRVIKAQSVVSDMITQANLTPAKVDTIKPLYDKFVKIYGKQEHSIITYWNGNDDIFAQLLAKMGFDSVVIKEKSTKTIGILRTSIQNKKGTKVDV